MEVTFTLKLDSGICHDAMFNIGDAFTHPLCFSIIATKSDLYLNKQYLFLHHQNDANTKNPIISFQRLEKELYINKEFINTKRSSYLVSKNTSLISMWKKRYDFIYGAGIFANSPRTKNRLLMNSPVILKDLDEGNNLLMNDSYLLRKNDLKISEDYIGVYVEKYDNYIYKNEISRLKEKNSENRITIGKDIFINLNSKSLLKDEYQKSIAHEIPNMFKNYDIFTDIETKELLKDNFSKSMFRNTADIFKNIDIHAGSLNNGIGVDTSYYQLDIKDKGAFVDKVILSKIFNSSIYINEEYKKLNHTEIEALKNPYLVTAQTNGKELIGSDNSIFINKDNSKVDYKYSGINLNVNSKSVTEIDNTILADLKKRALSVNDWFSVHVYKGSKRTSVEDYSFHAYKYEKSTSILKHIEDIQDYYNRKAFYLDDKRFEKINFNIRFDEEYKSLSKAFYSLDINKSFIQIDKTRRGITSTDSSIHLNKIKYELSQINEQLRLKFANFKKTDINQDINLKLYDRSIILNNDNDLLLYKEGYATEASNMNEHKLISNISYGIFSNDYISLNKDGYAIDSSNQYIRADKTPSGIYNADGVLLNKGYKHGDLFQESVIISKGMEHGRFEYYDTWFRKNTHDSSMIYENLYISKGIHDSSMIYENLFVDKAMKHSFLDYENRFIDKSIKDGHIDDALVISKDSVGINIDSNLFNISKDSKGVLFDDGIFQISNSPNPIRFEDKDMTIDHDSRGIYFSDLVTLDAKEPILNIGKLIALTEDSIGTEINQHLFGYEESAKIDIEKDLRIGRGNEGIFSHDSLKLDQSTMYMKITDINNFVDVSRNLGNIAFDDGIHLQKYVKDTNVFLEGHFVKVIHYDGDDKPTGLGGDVDELILPHKDYKYSDMLNKLLFNDGTINFEYVKSYDPVSGEYTVKLPIENPIDIYADVGRDYLDLDTAVLDMVVYMIRTIWKNNMFKYISMSAQEALRDIIIKLNEDLANQYRFDKRNMKHAMRCIQLFRWYCEMAVLNNCEYILKFDTEKITVDYYNKSLGDFEDILVFDNMEITDNYIVEPIDETKTCAITFLRDPLRSVGTPYNLSFKLYNINTTSSISIIDDTGAVTSDYNSGIHDVSVTLRERVIVRHTPTNPNQSINVANIAIDNKTIRGFSVRYKGKFGEINSVMQEMLNHMLIVGDVSDEIKEQLSDVSPVTVAVDRIQQYFELHHKGKLKGKRLITKK